MVSGGCSEPAARGSPLSARQRPPCVPGASRGAPRAARVYTGNYESRSRAPRKRGTAEPLDRLPSYRCGLAGHLRRLPWERADPRAAFVSGSAPMRSDPSQVRRNCRVGAGSPAPAHLGEGCHCVPAAGGTESWDLRRHRVLGPRVSVAGLQVRGELPELQELE